MANTIMTAKNSFAEGLIMDFAPDNTQATCMTSALNATLLTFNGNEMSLQNDMGNGRVETARLPEGYVPVGTCEFGDIIYIVSYNPITNKSLIGCFPSPERNISSEEIGNLKQSLSYEDFLEIDLLGNPTGKIKAASVKKIIFNKALNPGDKYFIYTNSENAISNNQYNITDVGNSNNLYGDYPKLLKLHVVAIEDSGKINYLDSTVKWYNRNDINYFIQSIKNLNSTQKNLNSTQKPDLDSYRTAISDAYTVFQSKVSGKLAILAELEKIQGFSCTHSVISNENDNGTNDYTVYLHTSWETNDMDINPSGFMVESYFQNLEYDTRLGKKTLEYDNSTKYINYTRHYELENSNSYDTYVKEQSFQSIKESFIKKYKTIGNNDFNYVPTKITLIKNKGHYTNEFIYNAFNSDEYGYYFSDNKGIKQYVYSENNKINTLDEYKINSGGLDNTDTRHNYFNTDTFRHNYFNTDIVKSFCTINIVKYIKDDNIKYYSNLSELIQHYTVYPYMPYGYLEEYKISNFIDYSKIGTGLINLNEWRYYNDSEISTLTFGLEAYPENNKGISKIVLEFYDNNGLTGYKVIKDRSSYSGVFTEILALDLEDIIEPNKEGHPGLLLDLSNIELTIEDDGSTKTNITIQDIVNRVNSWENNQRIFTGDNDLDNLAFLYLNNLIILRNINGTNYLYQSDAGILYSNWLYLVKIKVYYLNYNSLGNFDNPSEDDAIVFDRWFWTNNMWNDKYFNIKDYNSLRPEISIGAQGYFEENEESFKIESNDFPSLVYDDGLEPSVLELTLGYNLYKIYSANKATNEESNKANLKLYLVPLLANSYNTLTLTTEGLHNINCILYEGKSKIKVDIPEKIYPENVKYVEQLSLIDPKTEGNGLIDSFNLDIITNKNQINAPELEYISNEGEALTTKGYKAYKFTANELFQITNDEITKANSIFDLLLKGQFYSKLMATSAQLKSLNCPIYKPMLENLEDETLLEHNLIKTTFLKNDDDSTKNLSDTEIQYFSFLNSYNFHIGEWGGPDIYLTETFPTGNICYKSTLVSKGGDRNSTNINYSMSSFINEANSDIKGPFLPISWINNIDNKGKNYTFFTNYDDTARAVDYNWRYEWGMIESNYVFNGVNQSDFLGENEDNIGGNVAISEDKTVRAYFIMQMAVKNVSNQWIPLNAVSRVYNQKYQSYSGYGITLHFGRITLPNGGSSAHTIANNRIHKIGGFKSFAGIVAALLSQIYVKSSDTIEKPMQFISNVVYNQVYQELWEKDFVINISSDNNNLVAIRNIPLDKYLLNFDDSHKKAPNVNFNVVTSNSLIKFEHTCNYNINSLLNTYSAVDNNFTNLVYFSKDISGKFLGYFKNISDINSEVYYLNVNNEDDIILLSTPDGIILKAFDHDGNRDNTDYYNKNIKLTDFILVSASSGGFLKVKNGELLATLYPEQDNVKIAHDSSDGDNEVTRFSFNSKNTLRQFSL